MMTAIGNTWTTSPREKACECAKCGALPESERLRFITTSRFGKYALQHQAAQMAAMNREAERRRNIGRSCRISYTVESMRRQTRKAERVPASTGGRKGRS